MTPRTRAVMPVHLYGRPAWDSRIADFASANGLLVIEDVAQGYRGVVCRRPVLYDCFGRCGMFRFYPSQRMWVRLVMPVR